MAWTQSDLEELRRKGVGVNDQDAPTSLSDDKARVTYDTLSEIKKVILKVPPSWNRAYRIGKGRNGKCRIFKTQEAKDYQAGVKWDCKNQLGEFNPFDCQVTVTIHWYRARKAGDNDNRLKLIYDALEGIAYFNDKQIKRNVVERDEDKKNPRMEVTIERYRGR